MADFRNDRKRFSGDSKSNADDPPHSRLFVVCSKQLTEEEIRNAFSKFGEIDELRIVKDRNTGERKGVAYVKYAKTSAAAAALEALNGKVIGSVTRSIKVTVAASRDQGSKRDDNEEKWLRLFVVVPKTMTNEELHEIFSVYGDIEYATIIKDREKQESKGFAYVKYHKFSHAAAAFEQCDRKYRAVFAEPRKPRPSGSTEDTHFSNHLEPSRGPIPLSYVDNNGFTTLQVISSPALNQDHIWKLFDIIPGMDYCQSRLDGSQRPDRLVSFVVYSSPKSASYALEKLHGLEYPIGSRLIVKPDYGSRGFSEPRAGERERYIDRRADREPPNRLGPINADLAHLAETIAQATSIIQAAGFSASDLMPDKFGNKANNKLQCSVELPEPKPVLDSDTEMEARCFIVCIQEALPSSILKDAFCRFGSLTDVYLLPNRNCGYAKYASRESAENAIKTLHGAEVCGVRLKVIEAEEPGSRKRMRYDEDQN